MEVARLSAAVELEEEVDVYVRPRGPRMSYTAGPYTKTISSQLL